MNILAAIDRLAGGIILSFGWRRSLTALAAGAISALALPPFDLFPVLFLTLPVFVWLMDATASDPARNMVVRLWQAFRTGWWFGFGYFLAGLWWIGNAFLVEADQFAWMLPFAVIVLPALLALFYGLAAAVARIFWRPDWRRILVLGGALAIGEFLRGNVLTGFPWNAIGYGAMPYPVLMQKAAVLGLYGVSAAAVPVFAIGALLANRRQGSRRGAITAIIFVLAVIAIDVGYGAWRMNSMPTRFVENVSVRLVQPAIDQSEKWSREIQERNFGIQLELSRGGDTGRNLDETTVLIWPESAFPFILTQRKDALAALGNLLPDGTTMIAGAIRLEQGEDSANREQAFNSVYTIDDEGVVTGASDKVHLVPFGEYLPFQELAERYGLVQLTHLRGGFAPGHSRQLLDAGSAGRFLPLICYEIIFPGEIVTGERPDWLLNVTNDGWFGLSPGPYQHWRQAVVRGVEEGLPVVRVANTGISSVTDANGRIIAMIGLGKRSAIDSALPEPLPPTFFSIYGNLPFYCLLALFAGAMVFPAFRR